MKLHTSLSQDKVMAAFRLAQGSGHISQAVFPVVFEEHRSHTHPRSFEIQLGSQDYSPIPEPVNRYGREQKTRRRSHNLSCWAATWREWGWFIAEVFDADPRSRWGTRPRHDGRDHARWGYFDREDFHRKTNHEFEE